MVCGDLHGCARDLWADLVWHGFCFIEGGLKGRKEIMMEEKIKALALNEFGTLEGVTISYYVDMETGRVHYCFTRK
jgi:hypothetical protein